MDIEGVLHRLEWTFEERKEILEAYYRFKEEKKILESAIARKITEMKIRTPFENAKYFEVSYDPTFYDIQLPIIEINDDDSDCNSIQIVYESFTLDISALRAIVMPVIREHIAQGAYPERVYRLVIGTELTSAVTRGVLPNYQLEFGVEPYFRIVYCPSIIGVVVIP